MEQQDQYDIDPIASKYVREEPLTPEEETLLREWISRGDGRAELLDQFRTAHSNQFHAGLTGQFHAGLTGQFRAGRSDTRIWNTLQTRLRREGFWTDEDTSGPIPVISARRVISWKAAIAVAASVLVFATGLLFWIARRNTIFTAVSVAHTSPAEGSPGNSRATLTLADGRHIDLDSTANGVLGHQGSTFVAKHDGLLAYNNASSEKPDGLTYNTLSTPRAGQFQLTLSDGTRIWLNNASSLHYPVWFSGETREVDLEGEAYFEVANDAARPFRVHIHNVAAGPDGGTIDVLGTSFNIMAYSDERAERATLAGGSIRFTRQGVAALLAPDEQSVLDAQGRLKTLRHVSVAEITAWKNGYFHFDHTDLQTTMRQLTRWYDITVDYQGDIAPQQFTGKIQRSMPLSIVLRGLTSDQVHFRLDGKRLTVIP
jgi:ferric-dicitrate binding protein FerR (iron transport regulator)